MDSETTDKGTMSDVEWEEYINELIDAHKQGTCNRNTCAQCLEPGDPLDWWLS